MARLRMFLLLTPYRNQSKKRKTCVDVKLKFLKEVLNVNWQAGNKFI